MTQFGYVLVTPVRDEERTIGLTIASVVSQTVRPREWVIVSDGSKDRTDEIVADAARRHSWIRLLSLPRRAGRDFGAVARNTETGVRALDCTDYSFIGLLDADVSFQPHYFDSVLRRFAVEPMLGLAGGVVIDVGTPRNRLPRNRRDVPGAVQCFRRACFDSLGGLVALPEGGWDALTCAMARRNGYETRLLTDLVVDHHKPRNAAHGGGVQRRWQLGCRDYALGYHPLFELAKCLSKVHHKPFVIGALAWWLGFCAAAVQRRTRRTSPELIAFVRREQTARLRSLWGLPFMSAGK